MILRRLAVAGVALSVGVLSFAVGRIVLSTVGSPEAVASVVGDVTALPEVRTELTTEITTQLADDPLISQFADAATIRNVVDAVLDGERFDTFTAAASEAAYRVFFEGVPSAEIDLDPLAFEAVERLGVATGVD